MEKELGCSDPFANASTWGARIRWHSPAFAQMIIMENEIRLKNPEHLDERGKWKRNADSQIHTRIAVLGAHALARRTSTEN